MPRNEFSPGEPSTGAIASLQASEDRFKLLVESVVDYGIFMMDPNGHITSWNSGAERIKGYSAHEIIGRHFSAFYPEDEIARGKCERELQIARTEGRFEEEGWRLRKDGSRFWANVVITAVRSGDGSLYGFSKVTRDLTARQLAEQSVRESEARLRLLVDSVKDYALFVLDPTGHVATWNTGAERLKGYSADEIIGKHFSTFYPESEGRLEKCEMELTVAVTEGRFEEEGFRVRKDGSPFWANVVITPIRGAHGELRGFAKVTRDLTERRRHEEERIELARVDEARRIAVANEAHLAATAEELRRARDRAEEATRLKDEFLATVSHELRTPLNAILGWSRLLVDGVLTPQKSSQALEAIARNAAAQNLIIDDLLDVSRIIAGQLRLEIDVVDLNRVIGAALDVVRPAAQAKGVTLAFSPTVGAPPLDGDFARLQQVIWNLLTNAVKFTAHGGRVDIDVRSLESSVEIEISDTGRGITADFLPRLFDRFSQEEGGHARRAGGLGLGLAIVKHLLELHGGTVSARSDGAGAGSSFVVSLPFTPRATSPLDASATTNARAASRDPQAPAVQLTGVHVLVVDDEEDARELVRAILEHEGATVSVAASAAEGLRLLRERPPDVVVSDLGMPEQDGYAFIRAVRALPRESGGRAPAIALTAYARAEDRRAALVAGFQNHLAKPVEPQELSLLVANLAGRFGV